MKSSKCHWNILKTARVCSQVNKVFIWLVPGQIPAASRYISGFTGIRDTCQLKKEIIELLLVLLFANELCSWSNQSNTVYYLNAPMFEQYSNVMCVMVCLSNFTNNANCIASIIYMTLKSNTIIIKLLIVFVSFL